MMFALTIIMGLVGLVLLLLDPIIGIVVLIFTAFIVVANHNQQKRRLEAQRHQEMLRAMRDK